MTTATDDQSGAVATADAFGHAQCESLDDATRELLRRCKSCLEDRQRDEPGRTGVTHFEIAHRHPGLDETLCCMLCVQATREGLMVEEEGFFTVSETGLEALDW